MVTGASLTSHDSSDKRCSTVASRSTATVLSPICTLTTSAQGNPLNLGTASSFLGVPDREQSLSISPISADHVFFSQRQPHPATCEYSIQDIFFH